MNETTVIHEVSKLELYIQNFLPVILITIVGVFLIFYINRSNKWLTGFIKSQKSEFDKFKEYLTSHEERFATHLIKAIKESPDLPLNMDINNSYYKLYDVFKKVGNIAIDKLSGIMDDINACRIAIYLFHDGTRTISGFDFLKITCVGEKIRMRSGIKNIMPHHANININILDNTYDALFKTGRCIVINDASTANSSMFIFISAPTVLYSQLVAIYDNNNIVIGFILAEFNHPYNKILSDNEYDTLKETCGYLAPIFIYNDYANLTINNDN